MVANTARDVAAMSGVPNGVGRITGVRTTVGTPPGGNAVSVGGIAVGSGVTVGAIVIVAPGTTGGGCVGTSTGVGSGVGIGDCSGDWSGETGTPPHAARASHSVTMEATNQARPRLTVMRAV
jgi:hypothetical protein